MPPYPAFCLPGNSEPNNNEHPHEMNGECVEMSENEGNKAPLQWKRYMEFLLLIHWQKLSQWREEEISKYPMYFPIKGQKALLLCPLARHLSERKNSGSFALVKTEFWKTKLHNGSKNFETSIGKGHLATFDS